MGRRRKPRPWWAAVLSPIIALAVLGLAVPIVMVGLLVFVKR